MARRVTSAQPRTPPIKTRGKTSNLNKPINIGADACQILNSNQGHQSKGTSNNK